MQHSIELCSIYRINKYGNSYKKYPKLIELYQKLKEVQESEPGFAEMDFAQEMIELKRIFYSVDNTHLLCLTALNEKIRGKQKSSCWICFRLSRNKLKTVTCLI
jgi:hypothetical protein